MKFLLVSASLAALLAVGNSLNAQTPTPMATPSPSPEVSPEAPLVAPSPPPEPSPFALPSPSPLATPVMPVLPDAATGITPQSLDIPESFAEPGMPPPPIPADIDKSISPSPEMVKKYNAEAMQKIAKFTEEQRTPGVPDLTIDGAIKLGIKQNPDIINAIEQIRIAQGVVISVRSEALPQLAFTAAYEQSQVELANPNRRLQFIQDKTWTVQFTGSQLLYNGGATIGRIRGAKFDETTAYYRLRTSIDNVIANVRTQFYQVILNRALVVAQQESVDLLASQLTDQKNRYEAGTVPRFNVLQAEVALANAKPPLIAAMNSLRIAQYNLVKTLGMDYKKTKPSVVPFNVVGTLVYDPRFINTDESIRTAIERSPTLKAQRQNILAQAENVRVQFAGYLPTLNFTSQYTWRNLPSSQNLADVNQGWFFGFVGDWAIFDGFLTAGNLKQARAQLKQSANVYNDSVRQVILDVQNAISNLQTAKETIESQEASVAQAAEALRLSRERLDAGAGTQLDVLNAQVQLLQAQTTVLQARFDYISATADYDRALSLNSQYEDVFDDPLSPSERKQFAKTAKAKAPQPPLPRQFQRTDPIVGLAANAPRYDKKRKSRSTAKATPAPSPTPKKRKTLLGIF